MLPYSLFVDLIVATLLIVTIGYAIRLNKQLRVLRQDKAELEKLATVFGDSTVKANESLNRLRATAEIMQTQIERAQTLHDDLNYLVDRGEKAADRLESSVRNSRKIDDLRDDSIDEGAENSLNSNKEIDGLIDDVSEDRGEEQSSVKKVKEKGSTMPDKEPFQSMTKGDSNTQKSDSKALATDAERELLKALRSVNEG